MTDPTDAEFRHQHLALQQAMLDELRALRNAQAEQSARMQSLDNRLQHLRNLTLNVAQMQRAVLISGAYAADGRHAEPLSLARHYAQVYSQNGEDGMIAEIFSRVGARDRYFVEIGVENGGQCNTRLLLESGWRGVWLEGSEKSAREAASLFKPFVESGALRIVAGMAAPDTVESLLDRAQVPAEFDFLSLDIDQHTHSVWRAMRRRARVACIEYNASVPPSLPLEVPYMPGAKWQGTNWYGAGLKALELIGAAKDLHLVGCDLVGVNAFFVAAAETAGRFRTPFTAQTHFEPPGYMTLVAHSAHPPSAAAAAWISPVEAQPD